MPKAKKSVVVAEDVKIKETAKTKGEEETPQPVVVKIEKIPTKTEPKKPASASSTKTPTTMEELLGMAQTPLRVPRVGDVLDGVG